MERQLAAGDAHQPGDKRPLPAKAGQAFQSGDKGLGGQILGGSLVAASSEVIAINLRQIKPIQFGESLRAGDSRLGENLAFLRWYGFG